MGGGAAAVALAAGHAGCPRRARADHPGGRRWGLRHRPAVAHAAGADHPAGPLCQKPGTVGHARVPAAAGPPPLVWRPAAHPAALPRPGHRLSPGPDHGAWSAAVAAGPGGRSGVGPTGSEPAAVPAGGQGLLPQAGRTAAAGTDLPAGHRPVERGGRVAAAAADGGVAELGLATLGGRGHAPRTQKRLWPRPATAVERHWRGQCGALGDLALCHPAAGGLPELGLPATRAFLTRVLVAAPAVVAGHALASNPPGGLAAGGFSAGLGAVPGQLDRNGAVVCDPRPRFGRLPADLSLSRERLLRFPQFLGLEARFERHLVSRKSQTQESP